MTQLIRRNGFGVGYGLMLTGLIALLSGFAIDSYLHADDPTLASREGIFTLSNPGHLMVAIGLCTTVVGACIGPYSRWVLPNRSRIVAVVVPSALFAIVVTGSFAWANVLSSMSHDDHTTHTETTAAHTDTSAAAHGHSAFILRENQGTVALAESTMHEPANTQKVTADNLRFADQFLADIRLNLDKYKDVNVAIADGYLRITPDIPLIGAHFFHDGYEGLDPAHPSLLLYQSDGDGGWTLAGVSFELPKTAGVDTPPDSPLGGLAGWHYHSKLCFLAGGNVTLASDQAHCAGLFVAETTWLLHVWAWLDSPEGVFNHANSLLQ